MSNQIHKVQVRAALITTHSYMVGDIMTIHGYCYRCEICDQTEDINGRKEFYSYWTLLNTNVHGN